MFNSLGNRRRFSDLNEQEILALAISSEEDDARIYASYAEKLRKDYPATAAMFDEMVKDEDGHRRFLIAEHELDLLLERMEAYEPHQPIFRMKASEL